jgi:hypothetical protein
VLVGHRVTAVMVFPSVQVHETFPIRWTVQGLMQQLLKIALLKALAEGSEQPTRAEHADSPHDEGRW